ncbi:MAG: sigma-70 family RNA polymerase sigma factor [Candidatus Krumholzibacteriota bacterium]
MALSDEDLIRSVMAGEQGAFTRLFKQYEAPIFNSMVRIVGDHDQAADITQQAFISAYEHLATYDPNHRFFSWLYRIAWNDAINCCNQKKNSKPLDHYELPSSDPTPEDCLLDKERDDNINRAIAHLDFKYRVVLVLRHYLDLSYAEIAGIIDLPVSTVRSRIHTARHLLRDELTRESAQRELCVV